MSEYKPLHKLILEGLEEGTVLESDTFNPAPFTYRNGNFYKRDCAQPFAENPFNWKWRVISTPPKKIEFETQVIDERGKGSDLLITLPDHSFPHGTPVRVTVEEKR